MLHTQASASDGLLGQYYFLFCACTQACMSVGVCMYSVLIDLHMYLASRCHEVRSSPNFEVSRRLILAGWKPPSGACRVLVLRTSTSMRQEMTAGTRVSGASASAGTDDGRWVTTMPKVRPNLDLLMVADGSGRTDSCISDLGPLHLEAMVFCFSCLC